MAGAIRSALDSWFVHRTLSHDPDVWATGGWAQTLGVN